MNKMVYGRYFKDSLLPMTVDPIHVNNRGIREEQRGSTVEIPVPFTRLITPFGNPLSAMSSMQRDEASGVNSLGSLNHFSGVSYLMQRFKINT